MSTEHDKLKEVIKMVNSSKHCTADFKKCARHILVIAQDMGSEQGIKDAHSLVATFTLYESDRLGEEISSKIGLSRVRRAARDLIADILDPYSS